MNFWLSRKGVDMSKYLIENLFGIEGWSIAWYGVIIAVGMVLGVILAIYRARKQGLKDDLIFDFILLALPIAIVCARGYYVVFEWNSYSGDILSIFKIWKGGLAIYGGVIGGLGRFLIEGLRTDSLYIISGIRVSQVLSLFLICGGILLYIFFVRRNKTKNVYSGRYIR